MKLRPHHLLDIISQYGQGRPFEPSDYGHAVHTVAHLVLAHQAQLAEMVVGADAICDPCRNLVDGQCVDTVGALSKQEYNDAVDQRVLAHLGLDEGEILTVRAFADRVLERLDGLETVCSHPGEDPAERRQSLRQGLRRMGLWVQGALGDGAGAA